MKKILFSLIALLIISAVQGQLTQQSISNPNGTIYFYQFKPPHYRTGSTKNPLIVSLHGQGEQGDGAPTGGGGLPNVLTGGIPKKINEGKTTMEFTYGSTTDGFVVLAPQIPKFAVWQDYYVDAMIDYAIANLNVDVNRVFLTGYSLGAEGTWAYAARSAANAARLAGIAPIAGAGPGSGYDNIANQKVAIWAFQGGMDLVYPNAAQNAVNAVNSYNPAIPGFYTLYPYLVHGAQIWDDYAYDVTNNTQEPNLYQWMLKVSRTLNPATNQNPTAVATIGGTNNLTLTAPVAFTGLPLLVGDASSDPDDIIVDYLWTQTSGRSVYFSTDKKNPITNTRPNTSIVDDNYALKVDVGDYQFNLRVRDYLTTRPGHTQNALVNLHVVYPASGHVAPVVYAGGVHNITGNTDQQTGYQDFYSCTGCGAYSYVWTIESFPSGANPILRSSDNSSVYVPGNPGATFSNLTVDGVYKFKYTVTTQAQDKNSDILTVNRGNVALPVNYAYINAINAGNNNVVNWATTSEINSDHFDIQRSVDGLSYTTIGTVKSTGDASLTTEYHFTDDNAPAGLSYYRLSQVDKDGKTALSKVVSVNNKKTGIYIERYPNPARESLNVTVQSISNGTIQVSIADMQGKTLIQQQWQKDQPQLKKILNVAALQSGMYQMVITMGQERKVSSFVKY